MSQLWFVYSRDKTFGPWSASEVRDQLRSGNIDPFDMVSSDGSPVKRPLVEVDEVFQSSRIQMGALIENGLGEEPAGVVGGNPPQSTSVSHETQQTNQGHSQPKPISLPPINTSLDRARPKQFQALAIESRVVDQRFARQGKRHYFVTDSAGRVLGPMSSSDVISLWQKGIVDPSAVVEKKGQPRKISLEKFVSFYQLGGSHSDPGIRIGGDGLHRYYDQRFKHAVINHQKYVPVVALIAVLTIVIGILGFKLIKTNIEAGKRAKVSSSSSMQPRVSVDSTVSLPSKASEGPEVRTTRPLKVPIGLNKPISQFKQAKDSMERSERSTSMANQSRVKPTRTTAPKASTPKPVKVPSSKKVINNRPIGKKPPVASVAPKSVVSAQGSAPRPTAIMPAPKPWVDGESLSITASFSTNSVQSCTAKCKLDVQTNRGPLTAIFFKAAFGDDLISGKGSASLTGTIRKQNDGSWHLIVSKVSK